MGVRVWSSAADPAAPLSNSSADLKATRIYTTLRGQMQEELAFVAASPIPSLPEGAVVGADAIFGGLRAHGQVRR
jgi:hypothetical protein